MVTTGALWHDAAMRFSALLGLLALSTTACTDREPLPLELGNEGDEPGDPVEVTLLPTSISGTPVIAEMCLGDECLTTTATAGATFMVVPGDEVSITSDADSHVPMLYSLIGPDSAKEYTLLQVDDDMLQGLFAGLTTAWTLGTSAAAQYVDTSDDEPVALSPEEGNGPFAFDSAGNAVADANKVPNGGGYWVWFNLPSGEEYTATIGNGHLVCDNPLGAWEAPGDDEFRFPTDESRMSIVLDVDCTED